MKIKFKNILWGLFFIGAAVLIIVHQMGYVLDVGLPSLLITILLVPVIVKSIPKLQFAGIFIPLALLAIVYAKPLGIEALTPWPILAVSVLLSIGFYIIFRHNRPWNHCGGHHYEINETQEHLDGSEVSFSESFGASSKYLHAETFRTGRFKCSFGGLKIYFDNDSLSPEGAEISLDCSFSGIEIYVPKSWRVDNHIEATLGGVEEKNHRHHLNQGEPVLTLSGRISFSGVSILYV